MKSIHIVEEDLPSAWERAVCACWESGERVATEYDQPGAPASRDVTAFIHVTAPFKEPRIHRAFPGGLEDLEKYRLEVLHGVHDHWIDPAAGKWQYTYHDRLFAYEVPGAGVLDQIAVVIAKLKKAPHSRRAQAITWQVLTDTNVDDPPCLQRLWFRVLGGKLHMNAHFRSNDAFRAAFMNMHALTELQLLVAQGVGVEPGEYIHTADSFHIYGSSFKEVERFLQTMRARRKEERTFTTEYAREFFVDGCNALLSEDDLPTGKREIVERRKMELMIPISPVKIIEDADA